MKYSEAKQFASDLRELADFIEVNGPKLPGYVPSVEVARYLTQTDYSLNEAGNYESTFNEEATKANLKRFIEGIGNCEKQYSDTRLLLTRKFGRYASIRGIVARELTCRKVVKGEKLVQATLIPARMEEEVEWVCDEQPSLLKLVAH